MYSRKRKLSVGGDENEMKSSKSSPAVAQSPGDDEVISVEEAAKLKILLGFSDKQYDGLLYYPSLASVNDWLKNKAVELAEKRKNSGLAQSIVDDVNSFKEYPLENVRVNFGIDKGLGSTKVIYYFPDLQDPHDLNKVRLYDCYYGNETRHELMPYAKDIDAATERLQKTQIHTKHGWKSFTCFFVADCKCGDIIAGIQGGTATHPCLYCTVPSKDWQKGEEVPDCDLRTIESIREAAITIEEKDGYSTKRQELAVKKEYGSVTASPMILNIPTTRFAPDALHIITCAVNSIMQYIAASKSPFTKDVREAISGGSVGPQNTGNEKSSLANAPVTNQTKRKPKGKQMKKNDTVNAATLFQSALKLNGVKPERGRSEYSFENAVKILKYVVENPNVTEKGVDLLTAFAEVNKYSEARDLSVAEIDELEKAIKNFFDIINTKYPDLPGKKIKLHMLKHHVIPFVKKFKSWGKFSAISLEGIHEQKAILDKQISDNDPQAKDKQLNLFKEHQMLRNYFS